MFELTLICVGAAHARCSSRFFAQQVSSIQSPWSCWRYPLNSLISVRRGYSIHSVFFLYKQAGCHRAIWQTVWQSQNNSRWSLSWCPIHWLRLLNPYLSSYLVGGSCLLGNILGTSDSVLWWSMIREQYVFESNSEHFVGVQEVSACPFLPSDFRSKALSVACSQLHLWIDLAALIYAVILGIASPMISDQHLISCDFLQVLETIYSWAFSQLLGLSRTDFDIMYFLSFNWSILAMVHCHLSYRSRSSLPVDVSIFLACSSNFPNV